MLNRNILEKILLRLSEMSAVALLGPRQVGKTTFALQIAQAIAPSPSKGFQEAASEFNNPLKYLLYPGSENFPVRFGVIATSLSALMALLKNASST
jgi:energy-coupling factor transporter ATP-binding protein EcfA2